MVLLIIGVNAIFHARNAGVIKFFNLGNELLNSANDLLDFELLLVWHRELQSYQIGELFSHLLLEAVEFLGKEVSGVLFFVHYKIQINN